MIRGGGGDSRGRGGVLLVIVCGDVVDGRGVVLDGVALGAVAVVRWGEHHRRLVCLRVLMVEVYHASAAVRGSRHTVKEEEGRRCQRRGDGVATKRQTKSSGGEEGKRGTEEGEEEKGHLIKLITEFCMSLLATWGVRFTVTVRIRQG